MVIACSVNAMMMFSPALLAFFTVFFSFGSAATTTSSGPTSTSSVPASTHTVSVGAGGLVFTPNQLTADVGDTIEFLFYPQNHSVARAEYKSPCIPYEDTGVNKQGFWSGFNPISVVLNEPPSYQIRVNDTAPIFFYCSAPGACIDDGMIGVINANDTETFEIQLEFAKNSTLMFSPGEYFPSEVVPTATPSPTGTTTTTTTPSATSTTNAPVSSKVSTPVLSPAAIAGISIAGAAVLIAALALLYMCGRQKTLAELLTLRNSSNAPLANQPSHLSMTSSATYPKPARYPGAPYDRAADMESNRTPSPPPSEHLNSFSLPIQTPSIREDPHVNGIQSPSSIAGLSLSLFPAVGRDTDRGVRRGVRRGSVPKSPGMRSQFSEATTTVEEDVFRPFYTDVPGPLRLVKQEDGVRPEMDMQMERERERAAQRPVRPRRESEVAREAARLEMERGVQRSVRPRRESEVSRDAARLDMERGMQKHVWPRRESVRKMQEVKIHPEAGPHELSGGTPTMDRGWDRDSRRDMGGMI